MGYGIPNFRKAFELLNNTGAATWEPEGASEPLIFPNPSNDGTLRWLYSGNDTLSTWQLFDLSGHLLEEGLVPSWPTAEGYLQGHIQVDEMSPNGVYIFQLVGKDAVVVSRRWILMR